MSNLISNLVIGVSIHALSVIVGIDVFSPQWWAFTVVMAILVQFSIHLARKRETGGGDDTV